MPDRPYVAREPITDLPLVPRTTGASADLEKRLAEQRQRAVDGGTLKTGVDGKMEFVPKSRAALADECEPDELVLHRRLFRKGDTVHVHASPDELQRARRPLSEVRAWSVAWHLFEVIGFAQDRSAVVVDCAGAPTLLQPEHVSHIGDGLDWTELVTPQHKPLPWSFAGFDFGSMGVLTPLELAALQGFDVADRG
jgi:hypothetical protein